MTENNETKDLKLNGVLHTVERPGVSPEEIRKMHAEKMRELIILSKPVELESYVRAINMPNALINDSYQILKFAMDRDDFSCVEALINAGADPALATASMPSPFWSAVRYDKLQYVKLFLRNTPEEKLKQLRTQQFLRGDTLLHLAVRFASPRMVKLLLSAGFDPKTQNKEGDTPLHLLDLQHSKAIANAFFDVKGALAPDFSIRNNKLRTAEQVITDKGIRRILHNQRRKQILMRQRMSFFERRQQFLRRQAEQAVKEQRR